MKPNQYLFEKFSNLLKKEFSQSINENEEGSPVTELWKELINYAQQKEHLQEQLDE